MAARPTLTLRSSRLGLGPAACARTFRFVHRNRPAHFAKATADLVLVDLEDAEPQESKVIARAAETQWLRPNSPSAVCVNCQSVHYQRDVSALADLPGLAAVLVPLADDPAALAALHHRLGRDAP